MNDINYNQSAGFLFGQALERKLTSDISRKHKDNLRYLYNHFMTFLGPKGQHLQLADLSTSLIEDFLQQYNHSATSYMNKRRDLSVLFNTAGRLIDQSFLTVKRTQAQRIKATLHQAYDKDQLQPVFSFLKGSHANLYRCCLMTYGCLLRPHEEIRMLTKKHFRADHTEIHLGGHENKGGRVRVVYVPDYVRQEIAPILEQIRREDNLFSLNREPCNYTYFSKQWAREKKKLLAHGLIYPKQTLYSFRHSAAIDVFRRTKDVYVVQKMMGHSSVTVTLKYLRSLGEFNMEELREAAPVL